MMKVKFSEVASEESVSGDSLSRYPDSVFVTEMVLSYWPPNGRRDNHVGKIHIGVDL